MKANAAIVWMIVAVPFLILSGRFIHEGHQVAFAISSLVLISSLIKNRPIAVFGFYVSAYVISDFLRGMTGGVDPSYPYRSLGVLMVVLMGMLFIYAVMSSTAKIEFFMNIICGVVIAQCVLALFQALAGIDLYIEATKAVIPIKTMLDPHAAIGTLGNNNYLAVYIAIALPFFARAKWVYFVPVILVTVYFCNTSTAVIAIGASMAYFFFGKNKRALVVIAGISVAVIGWILLTEEMGSNIIYNDRWTMWSNTMERILVSGWSIAFGQGLGGNTGYPYAIHNEWVQTTFHLGLVGITIVVWFLVSIRTNDRRLKASVIAACVSSIGIHPMHLAPSAILVLCVFALAAREGLEKKKQ